MSHFWKTRYGPAGWIILALASGSASPAFAQDEYPPASAPASRPVAEDVAPQVDAPLDDEELFDDEDLDLLDLEVATVVTASRHEQPITSVPYAVSVVTAADIRRSGARSIPDALRLVPGVDIADLTFANHAVSPRGFLGFLSNQVLVLVDGRQIYDSAFGGTVWGAWPFQLEDVERIEVIRGPGGVTWGANAVNGVINIITKDPLHQDRVVYTAGGGTRGRHMQHIGVTAGDEQLRLRLSAEYESCDGFRRGGSLLFPLRDQSQSGKFGLHMIYDADERDTWTLSAGSSLLNHGFPRAPMAGLFHGRRSGAQTNFVLGKWTRRLAADNSFELTAFVNDFQVSPGERPIDYRYQQFALQFGHKFTPAESHTLTWGVDTRLDLLDTTNSDPFMMTRGFVDTGIVGVYLQDDWRLSEHWTLALGGRVDYEAYVGFEPSARAALSYRMTENTAFYGAVSRAFHILPSATRYLDIPLAGGLIRTQRSPDWQPPTTISGEVGYRGRYFKNRLHANVNVFWNNLSDTYTLTPRLGPPGLIWIDIDNRGSTTLYGVEVDARFAATKDLTLLGHYTFQEMDWRVSAPIHDKDMISPPRHKFMVGATYDLTKDLHLAGYLHYVGEVTAPNPVNPFIPRFVDEYFRLDLMTEYEFWDDRAAVSVGVKNLIDTHHYEGGTSFLNDAEVPRMIYAQLRIKFE